MRPLILALSAVDVWRSGGGLPKFIRDEAALAAARGISTATVFPLQLASFPRLKPWGLRGWGVRRDGRWAGMFTPDNLLRLMGKWRREGFVLREVQIHYMGNYPAADLRAFLAGLPGVPVRLWLHDFHTICPSPHLWRGDGRYCGDATPSEDKCAGCSRRNPRWLGEMRATLAGVADRLAVVAPSDSTARIWLKTYPEFRGRLRVVPHLRAAKTGKGVAGDGRPPFRLCFAGVPLPHKGWEAWCRLVPELAARNAPVELLHFGPPAALPPGVRRVGFAAGELTGALRREKADFLFLWSPWPETYSYVYHEALLAGTWPLANALGGNVPDAIRRSGWGTVFETEGQVLDFLCDPERLRATLERARRMERPVEMAPNPAILDLPEGLVAPAANEAPAGRAHRSWLREGLWLLKRLTGHE